MQHTRLIVHGVACQVTCEGLRDWMRCHPMQVKVLRASAVAAFPLHPFAWKP